VARTGLEPGHSYVWFRVAIQTTEGSMQHDFKNHGLAF
jgi:hypothetical protein